MGAFLSVRLHQSLGAILPLLSPMLALALVPEDLQEAVWGIGIASVLVWLMLGRAWHGSEPIALSVLALSWASALLLAAGTPRWLAICMAGVGILTMAVVGVAGASRIGVVVVGVCPAVRRFCRCGGRLSAEWFGRSVAGAGSRHAGECHYSARARTKRGMGALRHARLGCPSDGGFWRDEGLRDGVVCADG